MITEDELARIALALPGVAHEGRAFAIGGKGFAWTWNERVTPGKPRVPNPDVLAVRVANEQEKQELIAADPATFFTEPHYNGFPAVLVRLAAVDAAELTELLTDAWRTLAPKTLLKEFDAR